MLLVVFASLNQVALLKRALNREGVYVDMLRTPRCLLPLVAALPCGANLRTWHRCCKRAASGRSSREEYLRKPERPRASNTAYSARMKSNQ